MSRRNTKSRCSDPYRESSGRWRVVTRSREGEEGRPGFATEGEALAFVAAHRATIEARNRTIEQALSDHLGYKRAQGLKPKTLETLTFRLNGFFRPLFSLPLSSFVASHGAELYRLYCEGHEAATHHGVLSVAKSFALWCLREKLLTTDPLAQVEAQGRPHKGKAQLHLDESRRLVDVATKAYLDDHDEAGLAVLMALLLGLRTGEVVQRRVRDVDDGGRLLWIGSVTDDDTKTEAGVRRVVIPGDLAVMLARQCKGRDGSELLFAHTGDSYVRDSTMRLCARAGLPRITGQGLRGTHASLAMEAGTSGLLVAASIGHTRPSMTTGGHYATRGSVQGGRAVRVVGLLEGSTQTTLRPSPGVESK